MEVRPFCLNMDKFPVNVNMRQRQRPVPQQSIPTVGPSEEELHAQRCHAAPFRVSFGGSNAVQRCTSAEAAREEMVAAVGSGVA